MNGIAILPAKEHSSAYASTSVRARHAVLGDLCTALFSSMSRRDQRTRGLEYVRGLLTAPGRKSIRNLAAVLGGPAAEQRLHHFVHSSTWDWAPVRRALAQYLARVAPPQAWVVRLMVIPKAGEHSVGVDRRFFPDLGRVQNAQQAVGIWAASEELCCPVNWRLYLSAAWLDDQRRRSRASIPDGTIPETICDCAIDAYLELVERWALPVRPIVLDARGLDTSAAIRRLLVARVPLLTRITGTMPLTVADPVLTGHRADVLPAHQVMRAARHVRQPVVWRAGPRTHTCLVAAVRVLLPTTAGGTGDAGRELLLLAVSDIDQSWPTELWLTNLTAAEPAALLRLTRLDGIVDQDFTDTSDQVGVRDFTGRSFGGWHRHVTLASAAHAVAALADRAGDCAGQASHVS
jgi:hypothetical protein